jgi:hypothetical protein
MSAKIAGQEAIYGIWRGVLRQHRLRERHSRNPIRTGCGRVGSRAGAFVDPRAHERDFCLGEPVAHGGHGGRSLTEDTLRENTIAARTGVHYFAGSPAAQNFGVIRER